MRRARIETLEKRKMFSVTDLIIDPFNAEVVSTVAPNQSAAIVDYIDQDEVGTPSGLVKMHLEDISLGFTLNNTATNALWQRLSRAETVDVILADLKDADGLSVQFTPVSELDGNANLVGDFNIDSTAAESFSLNFTKIEIIARRPETTDDDRLSTSRDLNDMFLLPYLEQDNLYKSYLITDNKDPDSYKSPMLTDITDGSSNTMMFASRAGGEVVSDFLVNQAGSTQGIIAILIGLAVDPSAASSHDASDTAAPLDTWEHAAMGRQGPAANGIIAILIGLTVDPSDPSGNTALAVNSQPSANADEFFSQFANTTLDDQALVATTYGRGVTSFYDLLISSVRGGAAAQITHDAEFEKWVSASQFNRGYLSLELENVLISSVRGYRDPGQQVQSILHEDNEFSFPRV